MSVRWWLWFLLSMVTALVPALVLGAAVTVNLSGEHLENVVAGLFVTFIAWIGLGVWSLGQAKFWRSGALFLLVTLIGVLIAAVGWKV